VGRVIPRSRLVSVSSSSACFRLALRSDKVTFSHLLQCFQTIAVRDQFSRLFVVSTIEALTFFFCRYISTIIQSLMRGSFSKKVVRLQFRVRRNSRVHSCLLYFYQISIACDLRCTQGRVRLTLAYLPYSLGAYRSIFSIYCALCIGGLVLICVVASLPIILIGPLLFTFCGQTLKLLTEYSDMLAFKTAAHGASPNYNQMTS